MKGKFTCVFDNNLPFKTCCSSSLLVKSEQCAYFVGPDSVLKFFDQWSTFKNQDISDLS